MFCLYTQWLHTFVLLKHFQKSLLLSGCMGWQQHCLVNTEHLMMSPLQQDKTRIRPEYFALFQEKAAICHQLTGLDVKNMHCFWCQAICCQFNTQAILDPKPASLKPDPCKDDLSDELLTGDSCDNHWAATHNRPRFNYFGCNYFLAFSSSDWGLSHQTMKTNNYMMPRGTTRWCY